MKIRQLGSENTEMGIDMLRNLVLARTKTLAAEERRATETWPIYRAVEVPQNIEGLSDEDLLTLFEKLLSRRAAIDSAPQC